VDSIPAADSALNGSRGTPIQPATEAIVGEIDPAYLDESCDISIGYGINEI